MTQGQSGRSAVVEEVRAILEGHASEKKRQLQKESDVIVHRCGKMCATPKQIISTPASLPVVKKSKQKKTQIFSHALSGTLGAVAAETVLFPVDTIKIRVQTQTSEDAGGALATALRIIRTKGLGGFYAGFTGAVVKESILSMNFWLFHGLIFNLATKRGDCAETPLRLRLLFNLIAKQLNYVCTMPFEVVSSVNQITQDSPGLIATAIMLYKQGGLGVFYRGLSVSMLIAINPAIMNTLITTFLGLFKVARKLLGREVSEKEDDGAVAVGVATGLSNFVATALTYPLIRAKVLQQTQRSGKPLTLPMIIRSTMAAEGVGGLYRGIVAMSFKCVLWNALMMAFKKVLEPKRVVTPAVTPGTPRADSVVPLFAREAFPAELGTSEKIHELLHLMRLQYESEVSIAKVEALEARLTDLSEDLRRTNKMLYALVPFNGGY